MFTITKKTMEWGGRPLTLETGRIARQGRRSRRALRCDCQLARGYPGLGLADQLLAVLSYLSDRIR